MGKKWIMPLSNFGEFDCDSTANWTFFGFQSLRAVSAQSQRIRSAFSAHSQRILSAFAVHSQWVSAHSQWSRQRAKFFQPVQNFLIRSAVSVESYCSLRGLAVHSPSNWRRLRYECAANPRRLQYDSDECTETALWIILGITEMTKLIVL